jgi:hypothetical protein
MVFVLLPIRLGPPNIPALASFIAATKQDDYRTLILPKVYAVARANKDAQFTHSAAYRLAVAKIAALQTEDPLDYVPPGTGISQAVEPSGKRFCTCGVAIGKYGVRLWWHCSVFYVDYTTANYSLQPYVCDIAQFFQALDGGAQVIQQQHAGKGCAARGVAIERDIRAVGVTVATRLQALDAQIFDRVFSHARHN